MIQRITFQEFLPQLFGRVPPRYQGYNQRIDPRIESVFAGAAFRFGHSMLSESIPVFDKNGTKRYAPLRALFFRPDLYARIGPGNILAGFASNRAGKLDIHITESVRSFLFGGDIRSDLAALNIQRGRDHNLPLYNNMRASLGYAPVNRFLKRNSSDDRGITSNSKLAAKLEKIYGSVNSVDLWVGGLAEDSDGGSLLGATFSNIISNQFSRLRSGDRFWYKNVFKKGYWRNYIESSSLARFLNGILSHRTFSIALHSPQVDMYLGFRRTRF